MSRSRIMGNIAAALDPGSTVVSRRVSVTGRLAQPPAHPRPQRAAGDAAARVQRCTDCLRALGVDVLEAPTTAAAPAAIAAYLRDLGLPLRLRAGTDVVLAGLPWQAAGIVVEAGPAQDGDTAGLSRAVAAAAETGTLALGSGSGNPVTLGFLPDTHVVLLAAETIVGSYEEACALVRAESAGAMPRTLNFVTGASRTGDIGGQIVMGAHGPRRLAVVLIGLNDVEGVGS